MVRTEAEHGAGSANTSKTAANKKEFGIFCKKHRQKHHLCVRLVTESSDVGGSPEVKAVDSSLEYNSEEDSGWASSDIDSESTDLEREDILPFHCTTSVVGYSNLRYGSKGTAQKGCIRSVQLA